MSSLEALISNEFFHSKISDMSRAGGGRRLLVLKRAVSANASRQQLVFNHSDLRFNHSVQVQLTASGKSKMLRRVSKCS